MEWLRAKVCFLCSRQHIGQFWLWFPVAGVAAYGAILGIAATAAPQNQTAQAFLNGQITMLAALSRAPYTVIWVVILVATWVSVFAWSRNAPERSSITVAPPPPTSRLVVECSIVPSKTTMPEHYKTLHFFPTPVENGGGGTIGYIHCLPGQRHQRSDMGVHCSILNYGPSALLNVSIPIWVRFFHAIRSGQVTTAGELHLERDWTTKIGRIEVGEGGKFEAFMENHSDQILEIYFPDHGVALRADGAEPERVPITVTSANPNVIFPSPRPTGVPRVAEPIRPKAVPITRGGADELSREARRAAEEKMADPYRQAVLTLEKADVSKSSNGESLTNVQCHLSLTSRVSLTKCCVWISELHGPEIVPIEAFCRTGRNPDKTFKTDFLVTGGHIQPIALIKRNLADIVSNPPFLLLTDKGEYPLDDNSEYRLHLELRSEAKYPTLVELKIATGVKDMIDVTITNQSV